MTSEVPLGQLALIGVLFTLATSWNLFCVTADHLDQHYVTIVVKI